MDRFLRLWAPAAALGLIIGCAGEEGADVTPSSPAPTTASPAPDAAQDPAEAPDLTPPAEPKPAEEPKVEELEPAKEPLTPPQAEEPKAEEPKAEEPKVEAAPSLEGPEAANAAALSEAEIAEIKKLPAADHELALAQAVCPVSNENLGSMDVPLKVTAEGRDFFICCKGCEKKVKSDPKGVLAKLDAK